MPAFASTYSPEMRAALFRGAIDDQLGVKGTLRAAADGELPDLSETDQTILSGMAYHYAAEIVRAERDRRGLIVKVAKDTAKAAHDIAARLIVLADQELTRLERTTKKTPVNTGAGTATAKMAREALALLTAADTLTANKSKQGNDTQDEPPKPLTLAGRIARDAQRNPDDTNPTNAEPPALGPSDDETNTHPDSKALSGLHAALPYGA